MLYRLLVLFITTASFLGAQTQNSDDLPPQAIKHCARCVEARENNLKHPNPYFYYEEYVEATKGSEMDEKKLKEIKN